MGNLRNLALEVGENLTKAGDLISEITSSRRLQIWLSLVHLVGRPTTPAPPLLS